MKKLIGPAIIVAVAAILAGIAIETKPDSMAQYITNVGDYIEHFVVNIGGWIVGSAFCLAILKKLF